MAKTAAERRATRKRKERGREQRLSGQPGPTRSEQREPLLRQLIADSLYTEDDRELDRIAAALVVLDPGVDGDGLVASLLVGLLRALWEQGWQPADVAHVVRRSLSQRVIRLTIAAIAEEARAAGAAARAPEEWTAQLAALGALSSSQPGVISAWQRREELPALEAWRGVLQLFNGLSGLDELQQLGPPPSRWGTRRARPATASPTADGRVLGRIRGLLAKAERTEFPEEADALTAKAQELMTRHAIDAAVLDAEHGTSAAGQVTARRVHIDNPYSEAKVRLLDAIATANGTRAIWLERHGMVTVVGLPVDLDSIELLFTSLLVQATRAMAAAGRAGGGRTRSVSFRRAFLSSYAFRIGERLEQAREQTTQDASVSRGTDLVPVLRARSQAVDDAFEAMFPTTYAKRSRLVDARGWHAGRMAAEHADLGSGREQVDR